MKKFLIGIFTIFLILQPIPILASGEDESLEESSTVELTDEQVVTKEDNVTTVTNTYFDLVLTRDDQLPFGQKVPYELKITSHIDSEKTQILWEIPSTMEVQTRHDEFISLEKGETVTLKANITPNRAGTYVITVNVVSWQYDTNYTNSVEDTLEFNDRLVLQPVSTAYTVGNILKIFLILILSATLIYLGVVASKKGVKYLKKWLTPPQ